MTNFEATLMREAMPLKRFLLSLMLPIRRCRRGPMLWALFLFALIELLYISLPRLSLSDPMGGILQRNSLITRNSSSVLRVLPSRSSNRSKANRCSNATADVLLDTSYRGRYDNSSRSTRAPDSSSQLLDTLALLPQHLVNTAASARSLSQATSSSALISATRTSTSTRRVLERRQLAEAPTGEPSEKMTKESSFAPPPEVVSNDSLPACERDRRYASCLPTYLLVFVLCDLWLLLWFLVNCVLLRVY